MTDTNTLISETVSKIRIALNEVYQTEMSMSNLYMLGNEPIDHMTKLERVDDIKRTIKRLVKDGDLDSLEDILSKIEEVPYNTESVHRRVLDLIDEIYKNHQCILSNYLVMETFELGVNSIQVMGANNFNEVVKRKIIELTNQRLKEDDYIYLRKAKVRLELLLGHRERALMFGFAGYIIKKERKR